MAKNVPGQDRYAEGEAIRRGQLLEYLAQDKATATRRPRNSPDVSVSHALKRIVLHLARSKEFPSGSAQHGYELVAPLDRTGHIDVQMWKDHRDRCRVRRFWEGEAEQTGYLVHKPGGSEHARWIFDYDDARTDDDEAGYRFGAHVFAPGEYLTLRDAAGEHTFRIISVENAQ